MRRLEILATIIVLVIVLGTPAAAFGYESFLRSRTPNEYTIAGSDGRWSLPSIRVKQGQKVKLRMTSGDVAHGFAAPDLDIDVEEIYPGKWVELEFVAEKAGTFPYFCTVLCHPKHGTMTGEIIVEGASDTGSAKATESASTDAGKSVYNSKCAACHGVGGQGGMAPPVVGLSADRIVQQVRTSTGNMPPFAPTLVSDDDLEKLVQYIESLIDKTTAGPVGSQSSGGTKPSEPAASTSSQTARPLASTEAGKALYQTNCAVCHGADGRGGLGPSLVGATGDYLTQKVRKPAGSMPAFPANVLSADDLEKLADYLASLGDGR